MTQELTVAQALVAFLQQQYVERDGVEHQFFAGCFGIFGHGNIAGLGQALQQDPGLRFVPARNEQAMVHAATAYAKQRNRLGVWACTSSVGPGATNMITGAATATINRLPVLLLPGDVFATRRVDPALQQLEQSYSIETSVNDAFRPVSKYWDRINRSEQLASAALAALRVLTDPADVGAVTLALPQDVQTERFAVPSGFLEKRVWRIERPRPDDRAINELYELLQTSQRPLIVSGGGVIYSEATEALRALVDATGIPVVETQAGKGSLPADHPCSLGAVGATGTSAANITAREADLVIGIGTRWSDFTTASRTAFQNPDVQFVCCNIARLDSVKHGALSIVADARAFLEALTATLGKRRVGGIYAATLGERKVRWDAEVERIYACEPAQRSASPTQGQVIGAVEAAAGVDGVVICAAGSLPGDLHKLWRAHGPHSYHTEYGYSCMGYEVAAGLGVKLAESDRRVYVLVGDGSWLMLSSEIVTAVQERIAFTVVLVDNHGYASIGSLSSALGSAGFGTQLRFSEGPVPSGSPAANSRYSFDGDHLPVDLAANAASLGAEVVTVGSYSSLQEELAREAPEDRPKVIVVPCNPLIKVGGYDSWWEVPVAEVSTDESVRSAYSEYESLRKAQRPLL